MAMDERKAPLPKNVERIIIWQETDPSQYRTATHIVTPNEDYWVVSGSGERRMDGYEVSRLIGGSKTVKLMKEPEPAKPSTPEEWEAAKMTAHILVEATTGGWKATVVTPGVHWFGSIDVYRYPKGEHYETYHHAKQEKAIEKAQKGLVFVRDYFERSKGNKVLP